MQFVEVFFYSEFPNKNMCRISPNILFDTLKYDCVTKTIEIFKFLPLVNNFVTIELSFLSLIISGFISSKTSNILRSFPRLYSSIFL